MIRVRSMFIIINFIHKKLPLMRLMNMDPPKLKKDTPT